jgi:hypothetical protein
MKRLALLILLVLAPAYGMASDARVFALEIDMAPGPQAGTYTCEAEVKNLESGETLSAPRITFGAGAPATAKSTSGDFVSVLKVSVDSESNVGTAELTVSRLGKVVASQRTSLRLR